MGDAARLPPQVLTAIMEALVECYMDARNDFAAQSVWAPEEVRDAVRDAWYPESWGACRASLRSRFFPDERETSVAVVNSRSVRAHRSAWVAATREDAVRALRASEELGVEDEDDLRVVARALSLLSDALSWSGARVELTQAEYIAVFDANARLGAARLSFLGGLCFKRESLSNERTTERREHLPELRWHAGTLPSFLDEGGKPPPHL